MTPIPDGYITQLPDFIYQRFFRPIALNSISTPPKLVFRHAELPLSIETTYSDKNPRQVIIRLTAATSTAETHIDQVDLIEHIRTKNLGFFIECFSGLGADLANQLHHK